MQQPGEPPTLFILDPSPEVTGAFVAARREAELLAGSVRCVLVLRTDARIGEDQLAAFDQVVRLPIQPLRRSAKSLLTYPAGVLRNGRRLARAMREAGCTRLQVNDYYLLEGAAARLFGFRGRLATWIRIDPANYGGPAARLWFRAARNASDRIVVVSEFLKSQVPVSLEAQVIHDPAADWPLAAAPEGQRLVFIGNYIEGKGQDLAIRAFHRVAAAYPAAELIFHGGGLSQLSNRCYRAGLQRIAGRGPGAGRIHLREFASDTGQVLDGALVALNLSRSESFSLACQEASGRGVAVIATRSGGPQEIIEDGRTGWLVVVDDEAEVAAAMAEALQDPERTARMGRVGAALIRQRFSATAFRSALADVFNLPGSW